MVVADKVTLSHTQNDKLLTMITAWIKRESAVGWGM
jgi:hypothetical protein